jgi:hypothetical protein
LVEDEVADDEHAGIGKGGGNFLVTLAIHRSSVTAANRSGIMIS